MQRDHKDVIRWLGIAGAVICTASSSALAQSTAEPVPDHAALIGIPMSAAEVVRSRTAGSTAQELQRRIDAAGVRRSASDRAASEGLNRALERMPATIEQAQSQAAADRTGAGIVLTSRQQIEPMYAVPIQGGGTSASHEITHRITR